MSAIVDVLTEHAFHTIEPVDINNLNGYWQVECNCSEKPISGPTYLAAERAFAEHQAEALEAAGFGPLSVAWAEGHESGFWNGRESAGSGEMELCGIEHAKANNPYKAKE